AGGSQFFVVTARNASLPPDYAIIGNVTRGLGVVDRIGKLGDRNEQPTQMIVIQRVRVVVGGASNESSPPLDKTTYVTEMQVIGRSLSSSLSRLGSASTAA